MTAAPPRSGGLSRRLVQPGAIRGSTTTVPRLYAPGRRALPGELDPTTVRRGQGADPGDLGRERRRPLPSLTRGLGEWVPDLRVEVIPGAGHRVPYEKPERINSLIREFIDQRSPTAAAPSGSSTAFRDRECLAHRADVVDPEHKNFRSRRRSRSRRSSCPAAGQPRRR